MFNYFLPGVTKERVAPGDVLDRELLAAVGLADVLRDVRKVPVHAAAFDVRKGPNEKAGAVVAPTRKYRGAPDKLYSPNYQTWQPVGDGSQLWLGFDNDLPLSTLDLERFDVIAGYLVKGDDGKEWRLPICRAPHLGKPNGTLPESYTFDMVTGEPVAHLADGFTWLQEIAADVRDWYLSKERQDFRELIRHSLRLLAVNYRLGPAELNALNGMGSRLLTQTTVHAICQASIGFEPLDEALNEPTGAASEDE